MRYALFATLLPVAAALVLGGAFTAKTAFAAAGTAEGETVDVDFPFEGPFGTFDRAALQRGLQVYRQVCSACHGMDRTYYRNFQDLGYTEGQVKAIAAEYTVMDGPNDEGEMFERPARPSDKVKHPFANENAARAANNGALPPDLSLIVKARHSGADHVYSVLTGYEDAPADMALQPGQHFNKAMPGHIIAMAAPLVDGAVAYEDGTPTTVDQYAKDVSQFLAWAAEPEMEQRKRMGVKVLLFLAVFAGLVYATKRHIWSDLH